MPEVHYVTVQIAPNQIVEGFYTVMGDELTMVYSDGEPVIVYDGTSLEGRVTHTLKSYENPKAVAHRLTKDIRRIMMEEKVEGFSGPINYGRSTVA